MFQLFELYSIELYSTGSKSTIVVTSSGTVSLNTSDTLKSLRLEVEARYAFGSTLVSFSQCNVCVFGLIWENNEQNRGWSDRNVSFESNDRNVSNVMKTLSC